MITQHDTKTQLKPQVFLYGFIVCQLLFFCIRIPPMKQNLKTIFFVCLILAAAFNLCTAYIQATVQLTDRTTVPLHSLGYQFMGLENVFKDIRTVGYYTDKDLTTNSTNTLAIAQFEQAQYMLAPTILDLNHTQYHWVIFDCTTTQVAMNAIKHLGFTPLKANHGIILAFNPNGI